MRKPPTGEPCAGEPHARFGGRGRQEPFPTPIGLQIANNLGAASCGEIALNEIKKQIRPDPTDQLRVLIREITDRGMHEASD